MGAKIQCSTCYASYHPLCARIAGLHMEITDGPGSDSAVHLVSFCPRHCTAKPELSGIQVRPPGRPLCAVTRAWGADAPHVTNIWQWGLLCSKGGCSSPGPWAEEAASSSAWAWLAQVVGDEKAAKPADADASGLWNAQPFKQLSGAEVPLCPAGCARAQPLEVWPGPVLSPGQHRARLQLWACLHGRSTG